MVAERAELEQLIKSALCESVKETMTTMFSLTPEVVEDKHSGFHLICSIGFVGAVEGSLMITLSNAGACFFVSKMLGDEIKEVTPDVCDGVGEIVNMLAGGIKTRLSTTKYHFDINIPTVIAGEELNLMAGEGISQVRVGFKCDKIFFDTFAVFKLHGEVANQSPKAALPKSSVLAQNALQDLIAKKTEGQGST